jgi:hypothetical protein
MESLELEDMLVIGRPPVKTLKALAVIATRLHQSFAEQDWLERAKSQESCVLCTLSVCDFLNAIGITAQPRSVGLYLQAEQDGKLLHNLGIGIPSQPPRPGYWLGHLVAVLPHEGYLIDTTLARAKRPAWPNLPGMMAVPIQARPPRRRMYGLRPFTSVTWHDDTGLEQFIAWLDRPRAQEWQNGPDAVQEWRRVVTVDDMRQKFGVWKDGHEARAHAQGR